MQQECVDAGKVNQANPHIYKEGNKSDDVSSRTRAGGHTDSLDTPSRSTKSCPYSLQLTITHGLAPLLLIPLAILCPVSRAVKNVARYASCTVQHISPETWPGQARVHMTSRKETLNHIPRSLSLNLHWENSLLEVSCNC